MLNVRYETEDWRNALAGSIDCAEDEIELESASTDASDYDDVADELCRETLARLADAGVEYRPACQQSVGAFVILQPGGDDSERAAFQDAMADALVAVYPSVVRRAKQLQSAIA